MEEGFRFVHSSDFHFSKRPYGLPPVLSSPGSIFVRFVCEDSEIRIVGQESHNPTIAKVFAQWLCINQKRIQFFLATGDLAATGGSSDLSVAKTFFFGDMRSAKTSWITRDNLATVSPAFPDPTQLVLMPGNHDRFKSIFSIPPYGPGNSKFDQYFESHWPRADLKGFSKKVDVRIFESADQTVKLAFVVADFALEEHDWSVDAVPRYLGRGKAHKPIIEEMLLCTENIRKQNKEVFVVWAIHFNPLPTVASNLKLEFGDSVIAAANLAGVKHIFCGHLHNAHVSAPHSGVTVHVAGSSVTTDPRIAREFAEYWLNIKDTHNAILKYRHHSYQAEGANAGLFTAGEWRNA